MPRLSRYNQFYPWRDGNYLAYNARSGAVALMTGDNYALLQRMAAKMNNGHADAWTPEEEALLKQLEYGLFIHADSFDELHHMKFSHRRERFDDTALGLTIAPTMACNMACVYCFENNKKGRMSAETVDSLIRFVQERAPRLKTLDVTWYGGEPLLALDIIEQLATAFSAVVAQQQLQYRSSIVTNGYLLSQETVDRLVPLGITSVQVTLDGPARTHDQKRPLKNGQPSFAIILRNLQYASTKMGVSLRVNVDKTFSPDIIGELLEELEQAGLRDRLGLHFGLIEASTTACANISENCYEVSDFAQVETQYFAMLLERGFRIDKLPSPSHTFCMSQQVNSYLIDPDGDLFRCFNYVGDKSKAAGNLSAPLDFDHPNFASLFTFDPFEDPACRDCNILPVCMGACPAKRNDRSVSRQNLCESWRYNLQPMLEIIAWSRQQAHQRAAAAKESV